MLSGASISRNPPGGMETALHTGLHAWGHQGSRLDPESLVGGLSSRMADETDALWLEVGFVSPILLDGSAATGWRQGNLALWLERSTDLARWDAGHFRDCSGSPAAVAGGWEYWARAAVPHHWNTTLLDLTATTDRYGKSITAVEVIGSAVSLPNFPYAMPADAATLQTDLRSAGYSDALVSATSGAAIVARARNYTVNGAFLLDVAMSGSDVSGVSWRGTAISLPSYPYAMPGQRAALQTDLRSAGYSGAVVTLYQDTWTIVLPDRSASGLNRSLHLTIDPGDPFPVWDTFGNYVGLNAGNYVIGTYGNVRAPGGLPLAEADKQFARLAIRHLT